MQARVELHEDLMATLRDLDDQLSEFDQQAFTAALISDFKRYVESDRCQVPRYFGRDAPFIDPPLASTTLLCHLHIHLPPDQFQQRRVSRDRTCDTFLIYCEHAMLQGRVMLIDIYHPGAHIKTRDKRRMRYLCEIAQAFQDTWE